MNDLGDGKRVRIYLSEADRGPGGALYLAVLELLHHEGCAGATAIRGNAGFGAEGRLDTGLLVDAPSRLPVVEWVDSPERIERVLPKVMALAVEALVTVEPLAIARHPRGPVRDLGTKTPVREVMTRAVISTVPDVPLVTAVRQLVESPYRALPVVDRADLLRLLVQPT